ncbi:transporter substrate-binding domain-containing protein [Pelistega ratti]|uniref:transporter substrate-binding domain-containing protein n=1 Tax=Pelistega ratti TaxID=2652177 RepID=UPI00135A303E|nr:transporter substrate-binding domain-containing protein [Pelistega ratti]
MLKKLCLTLMLGAGLSMGGTVAAEGVLKIGVEAMYPPFESKDANGKLVGFDIELADAVCAKLDVKCEWVESTFDGLIPSLNTRKFDFVNSNMTITEARKKVVNFTVPIYDVPSQLIVKKDVDVTLDPESLKAKNITVAVLQGSAQETFAKKHWQSKGVKVVSYANQDQVFIDLANGRVQGALQNTPVGRDAFLSQPEGKDFKEIEEVANDPEVLTTAIGFAVRKNDHALKDQLDQAINSLKEEGVVAELSKKYFGSDWTARNE